MDKAKQFLLAAAFNLTADHALMAPAQADPHAIGKVLEQAKTIKQDLFSLTEDGKSFFEYKEVWDKVDLIVQSLRQAGQDVSWEDFVKPLENGKTPLSMAVNCKALDKLFGSVPIWKGYVDKMDAAWFSIGTWDRKNNSSLSFNGYKTMKRRIAEAQGVTLREDQLLDRGTSRDKISQAVQNYSGATIEGVNKILAKHNDRVRKDDLFLPDEDGDTMFIAYGTWNRFEKIVDELGKTGEIFQVEDFLRKIAPDKKSPLEYVATDVPKLNQLFHPVVWRGRMMEMLRLYQELPGRESSGFDVALACDRLIEQDYSARFRQLDDSMTLETLTGVVNEADRGSPHFFPIRGLGIKAAWENIYHHALTLHKKGQRLTLDHMRLTSGYNRQTGLMSAVRHGQFDKVLKVLAMNGERLSPADLLAPDRSGKSILDILASENKEKMVLDPKLWVGDTEGLKTVFRALPDRNKANYNLRDMLGEITVIEIRQRFAANLPKAAVG